MNYFVTFRLYSAWKLSSRFIYFCWIPYKSFITFGKFLCDRL